MCLRDPTETETTMPSTKNIPAKTFEQATGSEDTGYDLKTYYDNLDLQSVDWDSLGWDSEDYLAIQAKVIEIIHGADSSIGSILLNCMKWETEKTTYAELYPAIRTLLKTRFPDYRDLEHRLAQQLNFKVKDPQDDPKSYIGTLFLPKAPSDSRFIHQRRENVRLKRELKKVKEEGDTSMRSVNQDRQTMRVMTGQLHIRPFQSPEELLETPEAFETWIEKIENSMDYHGIKTDEERLPAMLEYGGEEIVDVHKHGTYPPDLTPADIEQMSGYEKLVQKLNQHFVPFDSTLYHRFKFLQLKPKVGETMGHYLVRLKKAATHCKWEKSTNHTEDMILLNILLSMDDKRLLTQALSENYSLQTLTKKKGVKEISEKTVSFVHGNPHNIVRKVERDSKKGANTTKIRECKFCGLDYPHKDGKTCPARGKTCLNCQQTDHYARKCPQQKKEKKENTPTSGRSGAPPQGDNKAKGGPPKRKQRFIKKVEEDQETQDATEPTAPPPPYEDYESDGSFTK